MRFKTSIGTDGGSFAIEIDIDQLVRVQGKKARDNKTGQSRVGPLKVKFIPKEAQS